MVGIEPKYISNIAALPIELHGRCYSVIKHLPPSVPVSSSKMELTLDTEPEHTDQLRYINIKVVCGHKPVDVVTELHHLGKCLCLC